MEFLSLDFQRRYLLLPVQSQYYLLATHSNPVFLRSPPGRGSPSNFNKIGILHNLDQIFLRKKIQNNHKYHTPSPSQKLNMPPKNKAKAAGISASSFFDLKAELGKQEEVFAKNKAAGKKNAVIVGGAKRPDKVRKGL